MNSPLPGIFVLLSSCKMFEHQITYNSPSPVYRVKCLTYLERVSAVSVWVSLVHWNVNNSAFLHLDPISVQVRDKGQCHQLESKAGSSPEFMHSLKNKDL